MDTVSAVVVLPVENAVAEAAESVTSPSTRCGWCQPEYSNRSHADRPSMPWRTMFDAARCENPMPSAMKITMFFGARSTAGSAGFPASAILSFTACDGRPISLMLDPGTP